MIPKSGKSPADSRKTVGIHEFAALARSSLNGISQAVRDHVTKPTSLAQGRVAHLIEWKGWPKPTGPPPGTQTQFNSYCRLSEGEKEARFAAGVAEQFAIAEAKLRAWASLDDDDEEDEEDFNDEESHTNGQSCNLSTENPGAAMSEPTSGVPCQPETQGVEVPQSVHLVGSVSSGGPLEDRPPTDQDLQSGLPSSHSDCMCPFLEEEEEEEEERLDDLVEQLIPLQEQRGEVCVHSKPEWRPRNRSSRFDSCYSTSHSESPGEEDEEDEEEEGSVFHEVRVWHCSPRGFFSDRGSSGVASFDEEEEKEEAEEEKENKKEVEEVEEEEKKKEYLM
ncbi:protein FAM131A isoform X2 [Poeciliopsis prolifica]|nr:protein FAM131A isoform X2 [Poeciliopsis prolifica]